MPEINKHKTITNGVPWQIFWVDKHGKIGTCFFSTRLDGLALLPRTSEAQRLSSDSPILYQLVGHMWNIQIYTRIYSYITCWHFYIYMHRPHSHETCDLPTDLSIGAKVHQFQNTDTRRWWRGKSRWFHRESPYRRPIPMVDSLDGGQYDFCGAVDFT